MRLHTESLGDGDGVPVVCLHGLTGHGRRFRRLAEERLSAHRVVGVDYRGHGYSTWEPPWEQWGQNDSYALLTPGGPVLIDPEEPASAADEAWLRLLSGPPTAVLLTRFEGIAEREGFLR